MFLLLVILFKLVSEFTNLLQCDVPVSYLTQNSKIIKEICKARVFLFLGLREIFAKKAVGRGE